MTSTALPRLGSPSDLRAFLLSRGFLAEDAPFALPEPQPAGQSSFAGARIIAVAGDSAEDNVLLVIHVPQERLNKDDRRRIQKHLTGAGKDGLLVCSASWRTLRLYWLGQDGQLPDWADWTINPAALRAQDRKALELLDLRGADMFELDALFARIFRRARRDSIYANQGLFSSYFLDERLSKPAADPSELRVPWEALAADLPALAGRAAAILDAAPPALDAAATRRQVVGPLLEALGWEVAPGGQGYDLALQAGGQTVALCNVAPLGASLETAAGDGSAPDLRMIAALTAQGQPAAQWGVLTNGQTWRLFATFASSASGVYYEVDLADLRELGEPGDWRLWFAFFSQAWLRDDAARQQPGLTKRIYQEGQLSAQEVGEELKQAIFKEVFPLLATAIAEAMRRRGEDVASEAATRLIFRATLILLYRLLFLLYAESRRLLPLARNEYFGHSLSYLLIQIAAQKSALVPPQTISLAPDNPWMWQHLRKLFAAIDQGRAAWGVPRYNGGLFAGDGDPARELLGRLDNVGADFLADGLDRLAREQAARRANQGDLRAREHAALRFIDYMALDVRRLGSIYEGLLEYRLRWEDRDGARALVLENSHRERKASGSYYTPDYIVRYIVEQTVGPVLDARVPRFADALSRFRAARTAAKRGGADARFQNDRMAEAAQQAVDALLDVKVLDPAMGSGHFLVEAVDQLSDRIIAIIERPEFKGDNPILAALRETEAEIRASVAAQGVGPEFIDDRHLSQVNVLRRMVMKRCIYGVDLNDMAVELARLSLWLHSFTVGAPLSFLDHHLKHGNSLVGVWDVADAIVEGSPAWRRFTQALANQMTIARLTDSTAEQLDSSYALYGESERLMAPLRQFLNVNLAQHFGLANVGRAQSIPFAREDAIIDEQAQAKFDEAQRIAAQKRFFHWKLEFPEVFFDAERHDWRPTEEAGFDAVVGNPPYGYRMIPTENEKKYYSRMFASHQSNFETYVYFTEKSIYLLSQKGKQAFIIPNTYLSAHSFSKFRKFLLNNTNNMKISSFGLGVFDDVVVETVIQLLDKHSHTNDIIQVEIFKGEGEPKTLFSTYNIRKDVILNDENFVFNIFTNPDNSVITDKLKLCSINLQKICYATVGINTGYIKDELVSSTKKNNKYHKMVSGRNIDRYSFEWEGLWICYDKILVNSFGDKGRALPPEYIFSNEKILLQRTRRGLERKLIASFDNEKYYNLNRVSNVVMLENVSYHIKYVLILLNSSLLDFYFNISFDEYEVKPIHLRILPIRRIAFTTPAAERARLLEAGRRAAAALIDDGRALGLERGGGGWPRFDAGRFRGSELGRLLEEWLPEGAAPAGDEAPAAAEQPSLLDLGGPAERAAAAPAERSDVVHDLLAWLAERMIDLNKQKQAEMRRYLGGLEERLDIEPNKKGQRGIDALDGKTAIQNYLGDYQKGEPEQSWQAVNAVLYKNRKRLGAGEGIFAPMFAAELERDYQASLGALRPIKAELARTDALIDQIVYRLYGLSAAEVAVVEGAEKSEVRSQESGEGDGE